VVVVTSDVTERKRAEARIQKLIASAQKEKDRLLTLVNSLPDEVWFADAEKKIALVNPAVLKILVAEDNPSNQRVIAQMLNRLGYRADMAANGIEVLQALERQPYDLVFMDVKMPEMDGITATREIRQRWPKNGPKIIAITAYALDGDREKCLEVGMDDYLAKPVQRSELALVLKRCTLEAQ
jgi:CheY-like chemotaxis protein